MGTVPKWVGNWGQAPSGGCKSGGDCPQITQNAVLGTGPQTDGYGDRPLPFHTISNAIPCRVRDCPCFRTFNSGYDPRPAQSAPVLAIQRPALNTLMRQLSWRDGLTNLCRAAAAEREQADTHQQHQPARRLGNGLPLAVSGTITVNTHPVRVGV